MLGDGCPFLAFYFAQSANFNLCYLVGVWDWFIWFDQFDSMIWGG